MRLRATTWLAAAGLTLVLAMASPWLADFRRHTAPAAARLDVVLITIDTLRADHLGSYGDRNAATPVLDALAARGTRFTNSVAHVPLTLPSHASILTGVTPLVHGVRDNPDFVLGPSPPTLAEQFRTEGYETAAFVSGFPLHRRFGLARGFDLYDDRFPHGTDPARPPYVERRANDTVAAVKHWLDLAPAPSKPSGTGRPRRPLFLWVHFFDPHAPYDPPEPWAPRFRDRGYDGEIAFVDHEIGSLLDALDHARPAIARLVAVTADHGEGLGEHGEPTHGLFVYGSTIRVPLIFAGPGIPAGRAVPSLARGIDIAPTLLDLAGAPPLPSADGRSLRVALDGSDQPPEPAYIESMFGRLGFGWAPLHAWREARWMFIDAPRPELYDLDSDPGERHNVASERPDDTARLRRAVRAAVSRAPAAAPARATGDAATRLRSLGYVSGDPIGSPSLRDPKDMAALAGRIENAIAVERSDAPRAAAELRIALGEDPQNPFARRHLATALAAQKRFEEAIAELKTLLASGNGGAEALSFLGDCYLRSGRPREAVDVIRQAALKDPRTPYAADALAEALLALGRRDEARAAFAQALGVAADDPDALAGLANMAIERGDFAEARMRLEALRARDPDDPAHLVKLGVVLFRMNEPGPAIDIFRAIVDRHPGNTEALFDLGGALAKTGRPAEAIPYFERAVAAGAASPLVLNSLGLVRLQAGDRAGAIRALRQSLRARPNQPDIAAKLRELQDFR